MILSVASGKGGTGKTLVSTSLALALRERSEVQLLDCDVEEPNAHILLRPTITEKQPVLIPVPSVDESKCTHCGKCAEVCAYNALAVLQHRVLVFAELCHGCGACSYLCPEDAIAEEGREVGVVELGEAAGMEFVGGRLNVGEALAPPVIRKVKEHIKPDKTVIVDVSPGTSCPVVEAVREADFCLLVTEPTPFGLNDLALAADMIKELGIPRGVVLNRAGQGDSETEAYCRQEGIPILLRIPLDREIARLYSRGTSLVEGMPEWRVAFLGLMDDVEQLAKRVAKR
ncbi:MAG: (4Fe-4S)-binding protein [Chloroflexi bacterium]|nr:MAG: (4Fe-4S)-binding protein [Chloroflexota bacterium]RLC94327.1 MAG: (4Fe-4S)-binding protein [Chloroflexota bacterium]